MKATDRQPLRTAASARYFRACGHLAGVELPTLANTEASIPELKERIAKAIEFIKAIKPAQIDGSEDEKIMMKFASGERKFSGQSLLLNFCLPDFYFHATIAYDILLAGSVKGGDILQRHWRDGSTLGRSVMS